MAAFSTIATVASLAATVVGGVMTAQGQAAQGRAANAAAQSEAMQLEQRAGQERAAAQRQAMEQRRQARLAQSRALTVGAASGAGTDGSVGDIMADLEGEGDYRAALALYDGEERARGNQFSAEVRRRAGAQAQQAGRGAAFGTLLGTAGSLASNYGGGFSSGGGGSLSAGSTSKIQKTTKSY